MTGTLAPRPKILPGEFLRWEAAQPGRHQYLDGEVYAMAGGSPRHNLLTANALAALHAALRGGECRAFSSDQKIHVLELGNYVYADLTVVCGAVELHEGTTDVIENPKVVVEVLSKSTEQHDRGDKWAGYRVIPSLTDYVLVAQRMRRLEHFARENDGAWKYRVAGAGQRVVLTSGIALIVDELYENAFDVPGDE